MREAVAWLLAVGLRSAEGVDGGPPTATAESGAWRPEAAPLREGTRTPTADGDRDSEPVECITGMRPSGEWTPVSCHPGRTAPLPEGPLVHVVHTHPGGSSLSMADLWVLASRADVQSVSAVTADGRVFLAERGPRFRDLGRAYPPLLARVNDDVRRRAGDSRGGLRDVHADVNRALAARGVIRYREARLQMATQP